MLSMQATPVSQLDIRVTIPVVLSPVDYCFHYNLLKLFLELRVRLLTINKR